jgi:hypothetical protein
MSWLSSLFSKLEGWFDSPAAKNAEHTVETLLPIALAIVQDINTLAPDKTLAEFNLVATKYAVPAITAIATGQTPGNVALNLATEILQTYHAPTAATSLLNTVVQLAVTAAKTGAVVTPID